MRIKMLTVMSVILALPVVTFSQEWHGIVLLKSTCDEVKRALQVDRCEPPKSTYEMQGETVTVFFTLPPFQTDCPCKSQGWNVPPGTVDSITRTLNEPLPLSQFNVNSDKWSKTFTDFRDEIIYGNGDQGLLLNVIRGQVKLITYYPAAKNEHFRCSSSDREPKKSIEF